MRDQHDTTTAGPTVTHPARLALLEEVRATVAGRFGRRESRQSFWDLVTGLLMGLPCANCWTVAEAVGHRTPYRLQHLVSRAVWDADAVLAAVAGWVTSQLDGPVILVVDETGDAKASTDAVGAASQYSGSLGGMGVCQVAVHLSLATPVGHAVIGRRLYLGADWAGDEERRTLTGVPEEVMFATKPDLAIALLREAVTAGVHAQYATADEVYSSCSVRTSCRELGLAYVLASPANRQVTTPDQRRRTCAEAVLTMPPCLEHLRRPSRMITKNQKTITNYNCRDGPNRLKPCTADTQLRYQDPQSSPDRMVAAPAAVPSSWNGERGTAERAPRSDLPPRDLHSSRLFLRGRSIGE